MSSPLRAIDSPARWAADEFVMLFDDATASAARQMGEIIRKAVTAFDWG